MLCVEETEDDTRTKAHRCDPLSRRNVRLTLRLVLFFSAINHVLWDTWKPLIHFLWLRWVHAWWFSPAEHRVDLINWSNKCLLFNKYINTGSIRKRGQSSTSTCSYSLTLTALSWLILEGLSHLALVPCLVLVKRHVPALVLCLVLVKQHVPAQLIVLLNVRRTRDGARRLSVMTTFLIRLLSRSLCQPSFRE
jgi:hypothetical protein